MTREDIEETAYSIFPVRRYDEAGRDENFVRRECFIAGVNFHKERTLKLVYDMMESLKLPEDDDADYCLYELSRRINGESDNEPT